MQWLKFPPFPARVAFYCGVVGAAWPFLCFYLPDTSTSSTPLILEIGIFFFFLFLPFGPSLLIPAFQLRSWKVAGVALALSPWLLIVDALLSAPFPIDNRFLSEFPVLGPGALGEKNPGGPEEYLLPELALYIAVVAFVLRVAYRKTKILGLGYWWRVLIGGLVLLIVLHCEIRLTAIYWQDLMGNPDLRTPWILGSMTWLGAIGVYWAFVFGAQPDLQSPSQLYPSFLREWAQRRFQGR